MGTSVLLSMYEFSMGLIFVYIRSSMEIEHIEFLTTEFPFLQYSMHPGWLKYKTWCQIASSQISLSIIYVIHTVV